MDRYINTLLWRTIKSRGIFKGSYRKGTSGQVHHRVGARLSWYRRRTWPGGSVFTIRRWRRSLSRIDIQSHGLMTFSMTSRGANISVRLTWSLVITKYQSNPPMCGRLPSNLRRAFLNGLSFLLSWWMPPQPSWGGWKTYFDPSPTHSWWYIWMTFWSSAIVVKSTSTIFDGSSKLCDNTSCVPILRNAILVCPRFNIWGMSLLSGVRMWTQPRYKSFEIGQHQPI